MQNERSEKNLQSLTYAQSNLSEKLEKYSVGLIEPRLTKSVKRLDERLKIRNGKLGAKPKENDTSPPLGTLYCERDCLQDVVKALEELSTLYKDVLQTSLTKEEKELIKGLQRETEEDEKEFKTLLKEWLPVYEKQ